MIEPKTLRAAWENARKWYHFPPIRDPRVVKALKGGAAYDFRRRDTLVSEQYIGELAGKSGLPEDRCLEGILCHEIGHYMVFPRTLGTLILAAKMIEDFFEAPAKKFFGGDQAIIVEEEDEHGKKTEKLVNPVDDFLNFILQTFADMANDTASVLEEQRTEAILQVRTAMQGNMPDELNRNVRAVMLAYLNHQAGRAIFSEENVLSLIEKMKEQKAITQTEYNRLTMTIRSWQAETQGDFASLPQAFRTELEKENNDIIKKMNARGYITDGDLQACISDSLDRKKLEATEDTLAVFERIKERAARFHDLALPILTKLKNVGAISQDEHSRYVTGLEHRTFLIKNLLLNYLQRMLEIDFGKSQESAETMRLGVWTFGNIIIDMINKFSQEGGQGGQDGKGKGKGQGKRILLEGDGHGDSDIRDLLKKASGQDIREALREVSYKVTRKEYEAIREWIRKHGGKLDAVPAKGQGHGIGTSEGELTVDREVLEYYLELSRKWPLVATKKFLPTRASIRAWSSVERWRAAGDPLLALPHTSGGLLLPGVTKKIRITERRIKTRDYKVPHALIVIDSSGSTPNPKDVISYFVLGGFCTSRSYHLHDGYIGVINFSGSSFYLPYTRELMDALAAISAYQGGGTTVDLEMIRAMLGPEMYNLYKSAPERDIRGLGREFMKKEISLSMPQFEDAFTAESVDLFMFTDGGISNLDEVLTFLAEHAHLNRATVILAHGYSQDLADDYGDKINIERIDEPGDIKKIPEVCRRATQRHLNSFAGGAGGWVS